MPPSPPRPVVEPLEARQLLSASIRLLGHVLHVNGVPGVSNTVTVGLSADATAVVATVSYITGAKARAASHTDTKSFPLSDNITEVVITTGGRPDLIQIDQTYGAFPLPTQMHTGAGNDTVYGGDEPDTVWGMGGNDLIYGGGGNDALYGMGGNDTLYGQDGNDFLSGGPGRDSLDGGDGNDTLNDPYGPDTLIGGAGNNRFEVHALAKDTTDYSGTKDTLKQIPIPSSGDSGSSNLGDILGSILPFL